MIYIGDTPPAITNRATAPASREASRDRQTQEREEFETYKRELDELFAETRRLSPRHSRPIPRREAGENVAEGLRDALLGACMAQAVRGGVARAAKPAPFVLDPIDFDQAMAVAAIDHQERNAR